MECNEVFKVESYVRDELGRKPQIGQKLFASDASRLVDDWKSAARMSPTADQINSSQFFELIVRSQVQHLS
jgi:hypothetical protein